MYANDILSADTHSCLYMHDWLVTEFWIWNVICLYVDWKLGCRFGNVLMKHCGQSEKQQPRVVEKIYSMAEHWEKCRTFSGVAAATKHRIKGLLPGKCRDTQGVFKTSLNQNFKSEISTEVTGLQMQWTKELWYTVLVHTSLWPRRKEGFSVDFYPDMMCLTALLLTLTLILSSNAPVWFIFFYSYSCFSL